MSNEINEELKLYMVDIVVNRLRASKSFPVELRNFLHKTTRWDGKLY